MYPTMSCYDDAEGTLRDQGLEVVVIPYRPSPPPPRRKQQRPTLDRRTSCRETIPTGIAHGRSRRLAPTPRSRSAMDEASGHILPPINANDGGSASPLPPPPPPAAAAAPQTTRSPSFGMDVDDAAAAVPRRSLTDVDDDDLRSSIDDEIGVGGGWRIDGAMEESHGRGRSVARPGDHRRLRSTAATATNEGRLRSKSSPTASSSSSSSKKRGGRNSHLEGGGGHQQMGLYQMAKLGYQELCNAIIRPPRSDYPPEALGPEEFVFCGERFVRRDFGVVNERGLLLECSMWKKEMLHEGDEDGEEGNEMGVGERERQRQDQDDDDSNDENDHRCGQIMLNVDDWDESKERGNLYLQVPESFEDSSMASSAWNAEEGEDEYDDDDDDNEIDESRDGFDRDSPGGVMHPHDRRRESSSCGPYHAGVANRKNHRRTPVVIYLHGNSSGRPEVVNTLGHLLSLGVAVVAFDFAGSGKSEGEFVSLGYYEQEDLQTVIHHLRASGEVSTIALWGRSMGAATAIMYGSRDATVSCMIIDSAFTDLTRLAEEMVDKVKEQGINVPSFVVSMTLRMIKSSVKSQAGFSIKHISPISHVSRCLIPAMFVAGEHDGFINKQHSERLHARYAGDKNLVIVEGDHNSPRPRYLLRSACLFLQSCMQLSPSLELVVPMGTNLFLPPWYREGEGGPRGEADRIKTLAMNRARAEAIALSDRRTSLSVNDNRGTEQFPLQKQRSQPSSKDSNLQNDILLEKSQLRTRSCTPASRNVSLHTAADFSASLELPDMSKRQKDIQSSLFKILGQNE